MANVRRVLAGDESAWVDFKANGYPFKLRRELKGAVTDEKVLEIIARYVVACNIPTVDGATLTSFPTVETLDLVDEKYALDIIWKFYEFRGERVREPLTKNT